MRNAYTLLLGKPEDKYHLGVHFMVLRITDTTDPRLMCKQKKQ
jgi:hypothetical protein